MILLDLLGLSHKKKSPLDGGLFYFHSKFRIPDQDNNHAKKDWVILTIRTANNGVASQVTCVRLDSFQQGAVYGVRYGVLGLASVGE